ncbi:hypothetical protein Poli38472_007627 [Pythium oligandrum]|uniref:PDZ domain-containing protein n=1 Tax=Pythium oligandrum TaxID=41045 RepID=A0A8K1CSK3_PYTOL|nr:hypothetical protein Poli38472_007627 [Pythium oligandrum]|eukprot:TMW67955.1 hypothetical protein Poli38472_007627 [Pythium oligandrum]
MGETVTVRLFVSTQTYDIPCDPRQPAKWLLLQAKNIQRTNRTPTKHQDQLHDELEVLYNRTRRIVIDLAEPIGKNIAPMDVIDARTLLQTPDTTPNSAMFPWLRSYPGGLQMSDDKLNSANGLFFQQLYAYTLIGRRTPQLPSQRREKVNRDAFLDLLKLYVVGSFPEDKPRIETSYTHTTYANQYQQQQKAQPTYYVRPVTPPDRSASTTPTATQNRRSSEMPTTTNTGFFGTKSVFAAPTRRNEHPQDSDSGSDTIDDQSNRHRHSYSGGEGARGRLATHPLSPSQTMMPPTIAVNTPSRRATDGYLDEMENVFDIVFKQQAIGMKLGSDETKQYAVVKECFEGSEARRYPEIQNGVVILAVNGQEVSGLGLSRVLYRLREAPRPVVVRFGKMKSQQSIDDHHMRKGTWG